MVNNAVITTILCLLINPFSLVVNASVFESTIVKRHRFSPEVIRYAVWWYFRFSLSYRDVEKLMVRRGTDVSYKNDTALDDQLCAIDCTAVE